MTASGSTRASSAAAARASDASATPFVSTTVRFTESSARPPSGSSRAAAPFASGVRRTGSRTAGACVWEGQVASTCDPRTLGDGDSCVDALPRLSPHGAVSYTTRCPARRTMPSAGKRPPMYDSSRLDLPLSASPSTNTDTSVPGTISPTLRDDIVTYCAPCECGWLAHAERGKRPNSARGSARAEFLSRRRFNPQINSITLGAAGWGPAITWA